LSIWQAMSIYTRQRLIRTILVVLLFEYTNTANVVFQAFICQDAFGMLASTSLYIHNASLFSR